MAATGASAGEGARLFLARWLFSPLAGIKYRDWRRVLRGYGRTIPPRYWPRTAFTSLMSLLNSRLAGREERRYGAEIDGLAVRRPMFVIGHHRSGTTHLWNLLAQDDRFAYPTVLQAVFPHTFLTFEGAVERWARWLAPRKRPQDNVSFGATAPMEEERAICASTLLSIQMARHFPRMRERFLSYLTMRDASAEERQAWKASIDRFARKILLRQGRHKTVLFKAPDHTAKVALILELYPDARFVHIHRDPYEVYRSTRKMERDTVPLYAYQRPDDDTLDSFILWRYRAMYDAYFDDIKGIPDGQLVEISFAELDREPMAVMERIYRTLDLPDYDRVKPSLARYVDAVSGYRKNAYVDLPQNARRQVAQAWRPSFARWGYSE